MSIDVVMQNFDFERVHKAMVAVDWTWARAKGGQPKIPTIEELQKEARSLLTSVAKLSSKHSVSCGGFCAEHYKNKEGQKILSLTFTLESADDEYERS